MRLRVQRKIPLGFRDVVFSFDITFIADHEKLMVKDFFSLSTTDSLKSHPQFRCVVDSPVSSVINVLRISFETIEKEKFAKKFLEKQQYNSSNT